MLCVILSVTGILYLVLRLASLPPAWKMDVNLAAVVMSLAVSNFVLSFLVWSSGWDLGLNCIRF